MFVDNGKTIDVFVDGDEVFVNQHQMPLYEIRFNPAFGEPWFRVNKREPVTLVDGSVCYIYPTLEMFETLDECKNYVNGLIK